jgi:cobalamin-dependent methionine synthase I
MVGGRIIEAQVKVSVDAARPLPLVCALYAVESSEGVWLCAYYGANRSVFDFLPQKGADIEEKKLGIAFRSKRFVLKDQYRPELWEEFKRDSFMAYGGHGE